MAQRGLSAHDDPKDRDEAHQLAGSALAHANGLQPIRVRYRWINVGLTLTLEAEAEPLTTREVIEHLSRR